MLLVQVMKVWTSRTFSAKPTLDRNGKKLFSQRGYASILFTVMISYLHIEVFDVLLNEY